MLTFAELVDTVETLSDEEVAELKRILERRWVEIRHKEIVESIKIARRESAEGKSIVLSSPEEIKEYFSKMMGNED